MPNAYTLKAMVAMTAERIIGKGNDLPWHLPEDLQVFKRTTSGHPIVMGRKTFESIGRPLPKRQNIVITRDPNWSAEGVDIIHSPEDLGTLDLQNPELFIIGGSEIYQLFLPQISELYVSAVFKDYDGDTKFPEFEHHFDGYKVLETFNDFELRLYKK